MTYLGSEIFWGHPAKVQLPFPRMEQDRAQTPPFILSQVSSSLVTLYICFNVKGDVDWAYLSPFCTVFDPFSRGSKHKNRNCAWTLRAIASPFCDLVLLCIYKVFVLLPLYYAPFHLPERCGHISTPLCILHMVR